MRMRTGMLLAGVAVLAAAGGCATKGFVKAAVADGTAPVARRVAAVERGLEDAVVGGDRNAARIREVDATATSALDTATEADAAADLAGTTASRAETAADDARRRAADLEAAWRRLLFEVILREDHGRFGFADATVPEPVSAGLDALVERVRTFGGAVHLEIEGHTDATGSATYNSSLALRRAEAVRRYLHERHQVPLHKMNVISFGEEQPVAPNDTAEGRARNRRVVVRVLG